MKKVLKSHSEVSHVWAQQSQDEGRASRMFFEGKSIYSYGHHFEIARFITSDIVFFNVRRYSPSTAKHQYKTRSAISHKVVFTVPSMFDHNENVEYYIKEIQEDVETIKRARKGFTWRIEGLNSLNVALKQYINLFKREITSKNKEKSKKCL